MFKIFAKGFPKIALLLGRGENPLVETKNSTNSRTR